MSAYCASTLHEIVAEEWKSESGVDEWGPRWEIALSRAYEKVDDACVDKSLASAGSTALVVLVSPCQIIAANCGDSRAVLVRKTETIPLTKDHKPNRIDEVQRIVRGGGCILNVHGVLRVDGILAMTRAIGDQSLKPWVTSDPEVTFTGRSEEDECLILASDGLWDVMSSDEVGTLARKLIRQKRQEVTSGERSSASVANLIHEAARARSSSDNVAVIAIDLKPPRKRRQLRP